MKQLYAIVCASIPVLAHAQFVPDGPDAPDVTFAWSSGYTIALIDPLGSNNYGQNYQELIPALNGMVPDPHWRFQGYLVFQTTPNFNLYTQNVFDTDLARLVAASDIDDNIGSLAGMRLYQQFDDQQNVIFDTCYVETITADDAGLYLSYNITINAFTGLEFIASDEVCFVAVAYATNLDHVQVGCNVPDPILIGRKAAVGTIQVYCMNGFTAAVSELEPGASFSLDPLGPDQFSTSGVHDGEIIIIDQIGRTIMRQRVRGENTIVQVGSLPIGSYIATYASTDGRRAHARFVVSR